MRFHLKITNPNFPFMQIITLHNVNGLELVIKHSSDVVELDKLLDGGEYSRDGVSRTLCHLLDDVLALEKFIGYQLIIFFLEESEHVRPGVIDGVCHEISDIREIHFLDCGNYLLHKSLFESSHFLKQAHQVSAPVSRSDWIQTSSCAANSCHSRGSVSRGYPKSHDKLHQ